MAKLLDLITWSYRKSSHGKLRPLVAANDTGLNRAVQTAERLDENGPGQGAIGVEAMVFHVNIQSIDLA